MNVNVTFYLQVGVMCSSRMPEFFLVTLMSGSETTRHDQGNFTLSPPPNVDMCTIRPRISAGNAAGTSPIETVIVSKFPFDLHYELNYNVSLLYYSLFR